MNRLALGYLGTDKYRIIEKYECFKHTDKELGDVVVETRSFRSSTQCCVYIYYLRQISSIVILDRIIQH